MSVRASVRASVSELEMTAVDARGTGRVGARSKLKVAWELQHAECRVQQCCRILVQQDCTR